MKSCLAVLALSACVDTASGGDEGFSTTEQLATAANGVSLNGVSLNGVSLNGVSLNGVSLNGVSLNGVSLNGVSLNGTNLDAAAIVGSTWTAYLTNGSSLPLRIDEATAGSGANADVGMYKISYPTETGWSSLCGSDYAIAVPGTWNLAFGTIGGGSYDPNSEQMTLACRGKTIAKCVEMGYKPWSGYDDELASCVRLLRADYCGNGIAYTKDGNLLNLYDTQGIQTDTESWAIEAEWTPAGARCISSAAQTRLVTLSEIVIPTCLINGSLPIVSSCGSFNNGAVLISELPPLTKLPRR